MVFLKPRKAGLSTDATHHMGLDTLVQSWVEGHQIPVTFEKEEVCSFCGVGWAVDCFRNQSVDEHCVPAVATNDWNHRYDWPGSYHQRATRELSQFKDRILNLPCDLLA